MAFKIGIIGTGVMSERMADTICQMLSAELYAVASREEEKAKAFAEKYNATKYYGNYEALLEDSEVQLIYIATPNHLHYEQARACIQHGKPVLLEKPFTLNEQLSSSACHSSTLSFKAGVSISKRLMKGYMRETGFKICCCFDSYFSNPIT